MTAPVTTARPEPKSSLPSSGSTPPSVGGLRDNGKAPSQSANLYQRLAAVAGEVEGIKVTGKTAYGQKAMSIEDVEDALGDLLAKHGVVTGYHWNAKPEVVGNEGKSSLWLADITVWLANADEPTDHREDHLFDVGTSPSAAVSFSLKRFYKALFHLADDSDESRAVGAARTQSVVAPPRSAQANGLNTAQRARLEALNVSLPTPLTPFMQDKLFDQGYETGLAALTLKHEQQCQRDEATRAQCEQGHLMKSPALLAAETDPVEDEIPF